MDYGFVYGFIMIYMQEPSTITSMPTGPTFPHIAPVQRPASQGVPSLQTSSPSSTTQDMITNGESVQELKPSVAGMPQSVRPVPPANVNILNNLSQVRQVMSSAALSGGTSIGLPSMNQTPVAMHMSNMISSGMASSVPPSQTVFSSGQSGVNAITGSGTLTGTSQVGQNTGLGSFAPATSSMSGNSNIGMSQPMNNLQGSASLGQSVPGMSQGSLSGAQMVQSGIGINQNIMPNLGASNVPSATGTMIPTPGMPGQVQNGMQTLGVNNGLATNMSLPQQTTGGMQPAQSKYVKVWEVSLVNLTGVQPCFHFFVICRHFLEKGRYY